jgi:hypothetical protein
VWQAVHGRASWKRKRKSVSVLRPPWRSTVRTIAGAPAASARFTSACVTFQSSVGYSMYQIGEPCSLAHSSTVELPTVERII